MKQNWMKNYQYIRTKLYIVAILAVAMVLLFFAPFSLFAATSVSLGGQTSVIIKCK